MDFSDTPEESALRDECRSWLSTNMPTPDELEGLDPIQAAKLWQKRKYDGGWACIRWPKAYGGRDATPIQQVILNQEAPASISP